MPPGGLALPLMLLLVLLLLVLLFSGDFLFHGVALAFAAAARFVIPIGTITFESRAENGRVP